MTTSPVSTRPRTRLSSLDGLRGVAAFVVVLYHVALTNPEVAASFLSGKTTGVNWYEYALYYSPLHILWAGTEAVVVFFVLSGFVLALPSASGRKEVWRSYYPRRIIRLYLPAIASLIFALLTTLVVNRTVSSGASIWINDHATLPHGILQAVLGSSLMGGSGALNTPLWTLRWEVLFSLLLPAYLLAMRTFKTHPIVYSAALLAITCIGSVTGALDGALTYLPIFSLGTVLAYNRDGLENWAGRLSNRWWAVFGGLTVLLLTSNVMLLPVMEEARLAQSASLVLTAIGAMAAVILAAWCPPVRALLNRPVVRWLGRVSFSLYLIHEPIVVAVSFVVGDQAPLWSLYVVAVPLSLLAAEVFFRLVEGPSHRLSQAIGRKLRPALAADSQSAPGTP